MFFGSSTVEHEQNLPKNKNGINDLFQAQLESPRLLRQIAAETNVGERRSGTLLDGGA